MVAIKGGQKVDPVAVGQVVERPVGPCDIEGIASELESIPLNPTSYSQGEEPLCSDINLLWNRVASRLAVNPDTFPRSPIEAGTKLVALVMDGSINRDEALCLLYQLCRRNDGFTSLDGR